MHTSIIYFVSIFAALTLIDFLVVRPLTIFLYKVSGVSGLALSKYRKVSWFLLHAVFNFWLTFVSADEALAVLIDPGQGFSPPRWWGNAPGALIGVIGIGAFHMHHFVFFFDVISLEDIIHHLTNAGVHVN